MLKFQESLEEDYDLPKIISLSVSRANHSARVYVEDAKAPLIGKFPSSLFPSLNPSFPLWFVWSSDAFVSITKLVNSSRETSW